MKRITKIFLFFVLMLILTLPAHAEEYTYRVDEIGKDAVVRKWDELAEILPENVAGMFGDYDILSPAESVREKTGAGFWLGAAWELFSSAAKDALPDITVLLTLILLMAVSRAVLPESARHSHFSAELP